MPPKPPIEERMRECAGDIVEMILTGADSAVRKMGIAVNANCPDAKAAQIELREAVSEMIALYFRDSRLFER